MAVKWVNSKYPGVRFREHETRVHKRKKDRYFSIRYYRDGKQVEESLGWLSNGMTMEEAQEIRGKIIQNIKKGDKPQSFAEMREIGEAALRAEKEQKEAERRELVTFGEMAGLFLEWSKDNKKSYNADKSRYEKHLEPRYKDTPIKNISSFHLEKLKSVLKKEELSPASIVQCLQLVKVIFNKTRLWGKHSCQFPAVSFPKVSNRRVAFLMPEQSELLLETIKSRSTMLWVQSVLGLYAGLRWGEIAGLELSDIDDDSGLIHIRDPKGGIDRHAYITDPIQKAMAEWWTVANKKPGLVFPDRHGKKARRVSPTFARIVDELGFNEGVTDARQQIVFHSLRHSFASWLVMGGEGLQTVQELMGHRDIATTQRYAHLAPDIKKNAAHSLVKTLEKKIVEPEDQGVKRG